MKIQNIIEKKTNLKERLELISKYSNNSLVRNLSVPEKLFLYETKRVLDLHYFNTKPAHALFLDTKFKIKYICDTELSREERNLDVEKIVEIMKEKNIVAEKVYELENSEEQIRFELFKVIQNNFAINKCENCGRLFIPITSSNNPNQKGRNDQKYCNTPYLDTGKTCKEIGASNRHKEKVENSDILNKLNLNVVTNNKYINYNGNEVDYASTSISDYISVKQGDIININRDVLSSLKYKFKSCLAIVISSFQPLN